MYETLSGNPPFVGANTLDTIRLKLNDNPAPFTDGKSDRLLKRLNANVQKCLEKDPDDRYNNMESLKKDIILARDESDTGWHSRSLANRRRWRWSWLKMTPRKVTLIITGTIVLSVGTTLYLDSTTSNLPSEYESKSLWGSQRYVIKDQLGSSVSQIAQPPEKTESKTSVKSKSAPPPLAPIISNSASAETLSKRLINKFADADMLRLNGKFEPAATAYTWALKQWNNNEAQDLPDANWAVSTSKAYFALGLCEAKLGKFQAANDCYQQAIDIGQKDRTMPLPLYRDMQRMYERNQWKVNPVKAIMRVLSNQELLPPGAS
jgi:serine/threonine protein kinase